MLTVFIATFVIFALVIFGMSLGYLVKRCSAAIFFAPKIKKNCTDHNRAIA